MEYQNEYAQKMKQEQIEYIKENIDRVLQEKKNIDNIHSAVKDAVSLINWESTIIEQTNKLSDCGKRHLLWQMTDFRNWDGD